MLYNTGALFGQDHGLVQKVEGIGSHLEPLPRNEEEQDTHGMRDRLRQLVRLGNRKFEEKLIKWRSESDWRK